MGHPSFDSNVKEAAGVQQVARLSEGSVISMVPLRHQGAVHLLGRLRPPQ
jgi:hypothetical protein